jgi:proline iminopeptidase
MTIAQFLRDLDEVVELVRRQSAKDTMVLLGHSWGTVLGALYTYQHPEKVVAYVGTGQVADMREEGSIVPGAERPDQVSNGG